MRRNVFSICLFVGLIFIGLSTLTPYARAEDDSEFTRVRRIYIEGARFMQESRYQDAIPMLGQAYQMLSRSVKRGSKNKRVLRAYRKLRYFLGRSHYEVGSKKQKSKSKADKKYTRDHYEKGIPLLRAFIKQSKSGKRRKKSAQYLAVMTLWLQKNPPPKKIAKIKKIFIKVKEKPKSRPLHPVPLVILAVGVATALGGVVTAILANNNVSERDKVHSTILNSGSKTPFAGEVARLHRQAESLATTSYALWAVGGGIAVVGLVLVFVIRPAIPNTPSSKLPPKTKKAKSKGLLDPTHGTFQLWGEKAQ